MIRPKDKLLKILLENEVLFMVQENHKRYSYTWEKLHLAILCLVSDNEQWKRIRDAYASIKIVRLEKEKFPPHLHDKYDELMDIFEKYEEDFQTL